jgi:hypothetical protein
MTAYCAPHQQTSLKMTPKTVAFSRRETRQTPSAKENRRCELLFQFDYARIAAISG